MRSCLEGAKTSEKKTSHTADSLFELCFIGEMGFDFVFVVLSFWESFGIVCFQALVEKTVFSRGFWFDDCYDWLQKCHAKSTSSNFCDCSICSCILECLFFSYDP